MDYTVSDRHCTAKQRILYLRCVSLYRVTLFRHLPNGAVLIGKKADFLLGVLHGLLQTKGERANSKLVDLMYNPDVFYYDFFDAFLRWAKALSMLLS